MRVMRRPELATDKASSSAVGVSTIEHVELCRGAVGAADGLLNASSP